MVFRVCGEVWVKGLGDDAKSTHLFDKQGSSPVYALPGGDWTKENEDYGERRANRGRLVVGIMIPVVYGLRD